MYNKSQWQNRVSSQLNGWKNKMNNQMGQYRQKARYEGRNMYQGVQRDFNKGRREARQSLEEIVESKKKDLIDHGTTLAHDLTKKLVNTEMDL